MAYHHAAAITNRARAGGGVPADAILRKMEVTGGDDFVESDGLTGNPAKDYMVAEIIDRTPVQGYLEQDAPRRNPQNSRSQLNLRYNMTRGSSAELPRHPDLFVGFTGNDPRGAENTPRFEEARRHMVARFQRMAPLMGRSSGHGGGRADSATGDVEGPEQVADRPMSGPALQRARVDNHKLMKHRLRVFTTSKDGRSSGRNVVSDAAALEGESYRRQSLMDTMTEQWDEGDGVMAGSFAGHERSDAAHGADYGGREGFVGGGGGTTIGRGHDSWRASKLSRSGTPTTAMAVARYGQGTSGRTKQAGSRAMHDQRAQDAQQQQLGKERFGMSTAANRSMARAMSTAAQSGRAADLHDAEQAGADWGRQSTGDTHRHGATVDGKTDVARTYMSVMPGNHTQAARAQMVGRATGSGQADALAISAAGSGARQQMVWRSERDHSRATLAQNMSQASSRGLSREEAGDSVQAMYKAVTTSAVAAQPDFTNANVGGHARGRGITPSGNEAAGGGNSKVQQSSDVSLRNSAASRSLPAANYAASAAVIDPSNEAGLNLAAQMAAAGGMPIAVADMALNAVGMKTSAKGPQFRGQTQMTDYVDGTEQESGIDIGDRDERGFSRHAAPGLKPFRYDSVARTDGSSGPGEDSMSGEVLF